MYVHSSLILLRITGAFIISDVRHGEAQDCRHTGQLAKLCKTQVRNIKLYEILHKKNYKKLIFKERRHSFRHEREAKEEKILSVPYEVSNPGHNSGGTRGKARGGLEPPTPPHSNPWGFLITCLTPTFSPNDRIAYYNSTDVFFSNGGEGGGGVEKGGN